MDSGAAESSLYSVARSLLGGSLCVLATLLQELVGCLCLAGEVAVVGEQLLEVDGLFIKKHTSNDWGCLVSEGFLDCSINVVSDEGLSIFALLRVETGNINGAWQEDHVLVFLRWLLLLLHHRAGILHWVALHHWLLLLSRSGWLRRLVTLRFVDIVLLL